MVHQSIQHQVFGATGYLTGEPYRLEHCYVSEARVPRRYAGHRGWSYAVLLRFNIILMECLFTALILYAPFGGLHS